MPSSVWGLAGVGSAEGLGDNGISETPLLRKRDLEGSPLWHSGDVNDPPSGIGENGLSEVPQSNNVRGTSGITGRGEIQDGITRYGEVSQTRAKSPEESGKLFLWRGGPMTSKKASITDDKERSCNEVQKALEVPDGDATRETGKRGGLPQDVDRARNPLSPLIFSPVTYHCLAGEGKNMSSPLENHKSDNETSSAKESTRIRWGREDNMTTVDWRYERNMYQQQASVLAVGGDGVAAAIRTGFIKLEGWFYTAVIAILTAICAAYIDIGAQYFADLRVGICQGMFWLDRRHCCGSQFAIEFENNRCDRTITTHGIDEFDQSQWRSWPDMLGVFNPFFLPISSYFVYVFIATSLAVIAAALVQIFSPHAAGSGIPEVKTILGGFVMKGVLGGWTLLIKCVGLCLGVGSGLSLGKEGPMVHVACCWSNLASRFSIKYYDNEAKKRELLSAACAAGVSVAFGAPIGGVLFSLEEVSTYFPPKTLWKSFFCAVSAALVLKWIDPSGSGNLTMFQMDTVSLSSTWEIVELIPFAVLGLLGGAFGAAFVHLNVRWNAKRKESKFFLQNPIIEVLIVAFLTACVNFLLPMLRGTSSHLLSGLFSRCGNEYADPFKMCQSPGSKAEISDYRMEMEVIFGLFAVFIVRFIQTLFTFGIGVPAGLFIPCLTIGGALGRLVGLGMIQLNHYIPLMKSHKSIHPGVYALVGACSLLGGVTRMTISLVVIMFELTGGLSYVLPFMVAVLIAKWSGDALCEHGIYDCFIQLRGYPFLHTSEEVTFTARACDIMEAKLVVITLEGNTIYSLLSKLKRYPSFGGFPLVTSHQERILLGYIPAPVLTRALSAASADPEISPASNVTFMRYELFLTSGSRRHAGSFSRKAVNVAPEDYGLSDSSSREKQLLPCKGAPQRNGYSPSYPQKLLSPEGKDFNISSTAENTSYDTHQSNNIEHNPPEKTESSLVSSVRLLPPVEGARGIDIRILNDSRFYEAEDAVDLSGIVDEHPIQLVPETPLGQILNIFRQLGLKFCLLTRHGKLEGLLTKKQFLAHLELAHPANTVPSFPGFNSSSSMPHV